MQKLSIITINYNNAEGLRKTMDSVFAQTCKEFEYIVIDGASTDGSVDVIRASALQAEVLTFTWVSEKDTGIYNAMNKGLMKANGEYTLMLNSGDYLVDEHVIERILPELHTEDMIQGNLIEELPDKKLRYRGYGKSDITFLDAMMANFPHQATFIKLSTMEQYGYFDDSYKKGADTYFFVTALGLGNATYRYVDIDITNFDMNGISSMQDPKWVRIDKEEDARWFGEHISKRLMEYTDTSRKAIGVYDALHKNKWIWSIAAALVHISEWLSPTSAKVKIERINDKV